MEKKKKKIKCILVVFSSQSCLSSVTIAIVDAAKNQTKFIAILHRNDATYSKSNNIVLILEWNCKNNNFNNKFNDNSNILFKSKMFQISKYHLRTYSSFRIDIFNRIEMSRSCSSFHWIVRIIILVLLSFKLGKQVLFVK